MGQREEEVEKFWKECLADESIYEGRVRMNTVVSGRVVFGKLSIPYKNGNTDQLKMMMMVMMTSFLSVLVVTLHF